MVMSEETTSLPPRRLDEIVEQHDHHIYASDDNTHALRVRNLILGRWDFPLDWNRAWRRLSLLTDQHIEDIVTAYFYHKGQEGYVIETESGDWRKWLSGMLQDIQDVMEAAMEEPARFDFFFEAEPTQWDPKASAGAEVDYGLHEMFFILSVSGLAQAARIRVRGHNIPLSMNKIYTTLDEENPTALAYFPGRESHDSVLALQWDPAKAIARSVLEAYQFDEPGNGATTDDSQPSA